MLFLNIFPENNNTFLHNAFDPNAKKKQSKLDKDNDDGEQTRASFNSKILEVFFKTLYPEEDSNNLVDQYYFPFFKNKMSKTPLDMCVDTNPRATEEFVKYLAKQPVKLHSNDIIEVLPKLIYKDTPGIG